MPTPIDLCCMPYAHAGLRQCVLHALGVHADLCQCVRVHADFCQCGLHALYPCRLRSVCAACRVLMSVCVLRALRVHAESCQCVHADFRQCMLHALRVHADSCQCVRVHADVYQCGLHALCACRHLSACAATLRVLACCYRADSQQTYRAAGSQSSLLKWSAPSRESTSLCRQMLTHVSVCGCMLTSVSVGCMPYVHADPCRRVLLLFVCWRAATVLTHSRYNLPSVLTHGGRACCCTIPLTAVPPYVLGLRLPTRACALPVLHALNAGG